MNGDGFDNTAVGPGNVRVSFLGLMVVGVRGNMNSAPISDHVIIHLTCLHAYDKIVVCRIMHMVLRGELFVLGSFHRC